VVVEMSPPEVVFQQAPGAQVTAPGCVQRCCWQHRLFGHCCQPAPVPYMVAPVAPMAVAPMAVAPMAVAPMAVAPMAVAPQAVPVAPQAITVAPQALAVAPQAIMPQALAVAPQPVTVQALAVAPQAVTVAPQAVMPQALTVQCVSPPTGQAADLRSLLALAEAVDKARAAAQAQAQAQGAPLSEAEIARTLASLLRRVEQLENIAVKFDDRLKKLEK
jgi:hypothetical protein